MQAPEQTPVSSQTNPPCLPAAASQRIKAGGWCWQVNSTFSGPNFLKRLRHPEQLLQSPTRIIKTHRVTGTVLVAQTDLPEFPKFPLIVKRQLPRSLALSLKDIFRPSRAIKAFETALIRGRLSVTTPTVVAAGENRRWGLLREAYLISALVPDAQTLYEVNATCRDSTQRVRVIRSFARSIASLHDAKFSHTDPSLTNFLVREIDGGSPQIYVIDLDGLRPRRRFSERLAIKDLSRLLHRTHAVQHERLWFLAQYCRSRTQRLSSGKLVSAIGK